MMVLHYADLERIREQQHLSKDAFCTFLGWKGTDYHDLSLCQDQVCIPEACVTPLLQLMLALERENLLHFKRLLSADEDVYFSGTKILKHLDKLLQLKEQPELVTPVTVEFHPSNVCNNECPYCTFQMGGNNGHNELFNISLLDDLVVDLQELDIKAIDISGGGEPTCHPEIQRIIKTFSRTFDLGLVTNGVLLDKNDLRETIVKHVTWCRISLDAGSQKMYEKMHGKRNPLDFESLVKNVKCMVNAKMKFNPKLTLGVSFLLTPFNYTDLSKALEIFSNIEGLDYFQIKPIVIRPSERLSQLMIFWDRRMFDQLTHAGAYAHEGFRVSIPFGKFNDFLSQQQPFTSCWGHPFHPTIAADGSVLLCCHALNELMEGNRDQCYGTLSTNRRFKDIWKSAERFYLGSQAEIVSCPMNCKLSETNKVLELIFGQEVRHQNFLG